MLNRCIWNIMSPASALQWLYTYSLQAVLQYTNKILCLVKDDYKVSEVLCEVRQQSESFNHSLKHCLDFPH